MKSDSTLTVGLAVFAILGIILAFAVGIALSAMINGYVLSVLWGWFVVPTFALPALSLPVAMGVALVVGYLTYQYDGSYATKEGQKWWVPFIYLVSRPLVALTFGWVVHQFV